MGIMNPVKRRLLIMWIFTKAPSVNWQDLKANDIIIDVREKNEYKPIKGFKTKNIPLGQIDTVESKEKVYLLCASGARSKLATKKLRNKGIEAYNISGGLNSYGRK